jgi:imidazoleglycerol-phosphate dehydratase / histidinol-phosphatase
VSTAVQKILFVDRDGTLVTEPADFQIDSLEKIAFMPGVFAALQELLRHGYQLVMVTNQDGLGSPQFPTQHFEVVQQFILDAFASQGIVFDQIFVCPHLPSDACSCRKPKTGLVADYLQTNPMDIQRSAMIGDRDTDLKFASNLGIRGFKVASNNTSDMHWSKIASAVLARRAHYQRTTNETSITITLNLDTTSPLKIHTGIGFFDHMLEQLAKHAGFSLLLECSGDLQIDEHHTVEDCALALGSALREALGDKLGIARYGFLLPMDEALAQVALDLSGRAHSEFQGKFSRETVGGFPTELVAHFFQSLAASLGAALHIKVQGENAHHMIEACFKGLGRTLRQACTRTGTELPTTKGLL